MINEEKVKIMTKLAMYEQGKGRKYLPVSKYYRSDYIGLALIMLGVYIVIGYLIVLVAYSVLTYIQYSVQYYRAKKSVREYYSQLTELNKIYAREEKKSSGRGNAGGYRK